MQEYIKALDVKDDMPIQAGHKIKLYGKETIVKGFHVSYNDALGKWETIMLTEGRGDPFERSLDALEVLPDQPFYLQQPAQHPGKSVWVKATDRLPPHFQSVFVRIEGVKSIAAWHKDHERFVDDAGDFHPADQVKWLDESPAPVEYPIWLEADTKPEHNVGVLVFIPGEDNHITSGMWDISNEWVLLDEYRTPEEEVTHWMPLPAFPEGYPHDMLSDEWVSTLKAIAKEELANRPSKEGNKEQVVNPLAFHKWMIETGWKEHSSGRYYYRSKDYHQWPPDETCEESELLDKYNQQKEGMK